MNSFSYHILHIQWQHLQWAQKNTFGISMSLNILSNASDNSNWWLQYKAFWFHVTGWKFFSVNTQYAESSVADNRTGWVSAYQNYPPSSRNGLAKVIADAILKGHYQKTSTALVYALPSADRNHWAQGLSHWQYNVHIII